MPPASPTVLVSPQNPLIMSPTLVFPPLFRLRYHRLLSSDSEITETVPTVMDIAGNTIAAAVSTSFRTGTDLDRSRPSVVERVPQSNSTVATNTRVQVQMSEAFAREDQKRAGILADLEATYLEKAAEASLHKEAWQEETMDRSLTWILT